MKSSFESLIEEIIPEINLLTASEKVKPGDIMESHEKDIVIGYLPTFLQDTGIMTNKGFETMEEDYDILLEDIDGSVSKDSALKLMKYLGLKANGNIDYKLDFDIQKMKAIKFVQNVDKIDFEIGLKKLKQTDRKLFKRFKGHILVTKVLYAESFQVDVFVKKGANYEADLEVKNVDVESGIDFERKENSLLIKKNSNVPMGIIGYKIKGNQLKEID